MKSVEIKDYYDLETRRASRVLYIGGELFDWNIDPIEIEKAFQTCKTVQERRAIHATIQEHFLKCFAVFMNKKFTLREINKAIETGTIQD